MWTSKQCQKISQEQGRDRVWISSNSLLRVETIYHMQNAMTLSHWLCCHPRPSTSSIAHVFCRFVLHSFYWKHSHNLMLTIIPHYTQPMKSFKSRPILLQPWPSPVYIGTCCKFICPGKFTTTSEFLFLLLKIRLLLKIISLALA